MRETTPGGGGREQNHHHEQPLSKKFKKNKQKEQHIATDEQGRRRFHGAFTGGFSAGYFNTVGSKEGWQPKQFKSSRANDEKKQQQQTMEDFMDEEELEEYEKGKMRTNAEYDAFGKEGEVMAGFRRIEGEEEEEEEEDGTTGRRMAFGTAAAEERTKREEEKKRGFSKALAKSILDYVKPVISGIGTKLLVKMGWRVGKSLGRRKKKVNGKIVFKATKEDEQAWRTRYGQQLVSLLGGGGGVINVKDNSWGIGYDPYAGAEEFRKRDQHELMKKRERYSKEGEKKQRGAAFGLGAFEVDDDMNVYDERPREKNAEYTFELNSEDEEKDDDENDRFGRGADHRQKDALRNPLGVKRLPDRATRDAIERGHKFPGFVESDTVPEEIEWFQAPEVPKEFNERHVFDTDGVTKDTIDKEKEEDEEEELPPPPPQMRKLSEEKRKVIESLARFVARNGEAFEKLAKQKQKKDKKFSFLFGGEGASSYAYCLKKAKLEERRNARIVLASAKEKIAPLLSAAKGYDISKQQKHDAESRGKLLGEEPLKRTVPPPPPQPPSVQDEMMKIPARGQPIVDDVKKVNLSAAINEKDKSQILATMSNMFTTSGHIVNAEVPSGGLQTAKELAKIREEREKTGSCRGSKLEERRERARCATRGNVEDDCKHENDYSVVAGVTLV